MTTNFFARYSSFYFIGICGVSMSALALFCLSVKKRVGGSDVNLAAASKLKSAGAKVAESGAGGLEDYDVVIYTDAVQRDDPELKLARKLGKPVISRGRFLAEVSGMFGRVIAVSGCHGKTTCTAMLANIFRESGRKFAAHIGGNATGMGNFYSNGTDWFITEACEYKKNFLYLKPDTAVVLSTEPDHLECYGDRDELLACYRKFASRAQTAVLPAESGLVADVGGITFGSASSDFSAHNLKGCDGVYSFTLCAFGKVQGEVRLKIPGVYNVFNALAAAAAAYAEGIGFRDVKRGLEGFEGVERRMQLIGRLNGARAVADYAHHPTEIAAALKTARSFTSGRLFVVFQPHTYSRTKMLFRQFVSALSDIKKLLIYRTFAAREYFDDGGSALTLARAIKGAKYGDYPEDIVKFASSVRGGDTVLFLGAGDIYDIARSLIHNMYEGI